MIMSNYYGADIISWNSIAFIKRERRRKEKKNHTCNKLQVEGCDIGMYLITRRKKKLRREIVIQTYKRADFKTHFLFSKPSLFSGSHFNCFPFLVLSHIVSLKLIKVCNSLMKDNASEISY